MCQKMGEADKRQKTKSKAIADFLRRVMHTSSSPVPDTKILTSRHKRRAVGRRRVETSVSVTDPPPAIPSTSTRVFKYEDPKHEPIPYDDSEDDYDD